MILLPNGTSSDTSSGRPVITLFYDIPQGDDPAIDLNDTLNGIIANGTANKIIVDSGPSTTGGFYLDYVDRSYASALEIAGNTVTNWFNKTNSFLAAVGNGTINYYTAVGQTLGTVATGAQKIVSTTAGVASSVATVLSTPVGLVGIALGLLIVYLFYRRA